MDPETVTVRCISTWRESLRRTSEALRRVSLVGDGAPWGTSSMRPVAQTTGGPRGMDSAPCRRRATPVAEDFVFGFLGLAVLFPFWDRYVYGTTALGILKYPTGYNMRRTIPLPPQCPPNDAHAFTDSLPRSMGNPAAFIASRVACLGSFLNGPG